MKVKFVRSKEKNKKSCKKSEELKKKVKKNTNYDYQTFGNLYENFAYNFNSLYD